jgi:hypothetical protein
MKRKEFIAWIGVSAFLVMAPIARAQQTVDGLADFGASLIGPCNSFLSVVFKQECGGGPWVIIPWLAFIVTAISSLTLYVSLRRARQERDDVLKDAEAEITRFKTERMQTASAHRFPVLRADVGSFHVGASLLELAIRCLEDGAQDPERGEIIATLVELRQLLEYELAARGSELPAIGLRGALIALIDRERLAGDAPRGVEAIWRLATVHAIANRYGNRQGLIIAAIATRSIFEAAHLHVPSLRLLTPRASVPFEGLWQVSMLEPGSVVLNALGRDAVRAAATALREPDSLIVDVSQFPILHGNVVARTGRFVVLGPVGL